MIAELRRIGVNAGWLLLGKAFGGVLSIAYLALATRTLGLADFGRFALVVAIGQAIAGFAGFQTWQFVVRYGMKAQAADDHDGVERVIAFAAMLDVAAAVIGSLLALAAVVLLGGVLGLPPALRLPAWAFCFTILIAVRSTPTGVLRLDDRFRDAAVADSVTPLMRAVGAGAAALVLPTVTGFLAAWSMAEIVTAAVSWRTALRQRRFALSFAGLRRTAREEPSLWRFVVSTNLASSLTQTSRQVTLLAVGAAGGPAAAGTFRLAVQLAQALAKLTQSFSRAAYAELVRALATDTGRERLLLVRLTATAMLTAGVMVVFAAAVGRPVLGLIAGKEFIGAYLPVVLLVGAAGFDLGGFAFEPAMTAHGRAGLAFWLRALAVGAQALLLVVLLPPYGVIGGAWATLGGSVVALLLTGWGAFAGVGRTRGAQ